MCSISSRTGGDVLCLLAEPLENVNLPDHSACFLLEDGVAPGKFIADYRMSTRLEKSNGVLLPACSQPKRIGLGWF